MNNTLSMKKSKPTTESYFTRFLLFAFLFLVLGVSLPAQAETGDWPKEYQMPEGKIVIYQPQLESLIDNQLTGRSAVSVSKKEGESQFGTMWFTARIETDRQERTVKLLNIEIKDIKFKTIPDKSKTEAFAKLVNEKIGKSNISMSLDRLLTMVEHAEVVKKTSEKLNIAPPEIIVMNHPAVLVNIDGDPELRKIEDSSLMRIINTPYFMVFDPADKKYYLKGGDTWFVAADVESKWEHVVQPPAPVVAASKAEFEGQESDAQDMGAGSKMPEVIVSTKQTEIIITEGEPSYTPIKDTGLLYVSNTASDLFMEIGKQKYYVLLSGRWYTSKSLTGSWKFVQSDKLPADFAKIPEGSEKASVLVSVAGTTQAKEAVLDTYIPQTVTVDRTENAEVEVVYDGEPKFEKIEKTKLLYAVNTSSSVIKFKGYYYLCQDAVWYISDSPKGPWAIAVNIPKEVYTIPPSSPVYNVTYVYVYDSTPSVVYVGYYPGYYGCYVYGGTVVYGTGYYYRGWHGTVYYARPYTWGFSVRYNSYTGNWAVRVGYGAPAGWWAASAHRSYWRSAHYSAHYRAHYHHNRRYDAYRNHRDYRRGVYEDHRDYRRDRHDQRYQDARDRQSDRIDTRKDVQSSRVDTRQDVQSNRVDTRQDVQNNRIDTRQDVQNNRVDTRQDTLDGRRDQAGQRIDNNNIYSDRQGNVYRQTDQGWQQKDVSGWTAPETRPGSSGQYRSELNQQHQARERGATRSSNYQQYQGSGRSGFSGSRGGGGRGRR